MSIQPQTVSYVAQRIAAGGMKAAILEELLAVGWTSDEAERAYTQALIERGVPVPERAGKSGRRVSSTLEIVLNLFSFALLGVVVTAIGTLLFAVIEAYFPDSLADVRTFSYVLEARASAVHYAIAALIVAFPIYVFTVRYWLRTFREDENKTESRLTKWVTYLVLFVSAATIVGDLIATLFTFFQGELTARFVLKALVLLAIAGLVVTFYVLERRRVQYNRVVQPQAFLVLGGVMGALACIGVVLGFAVAGSPDTARLRGFDATRADDLEALARVISSYAESHQALPDSIEVLTLDSEYAYGRSWRDPETGAYYGYQALEQTVASDGSFHATFELCATFALDTESDVTPALNDAALKWRQHGAGLSCDREEVVTRPFGVKPALPFVGED